MSPTANLDPRPTGTTPAQEKLVPPVPRLAGDFTVPRFTDYQAAAPRESSAGRPGSAAPLRPRKGQLLVGLALIAMCGCGAYALWDGFFRYEAYGIVEGHVIEVLPPWNGEVHHVHVREGDRVAPGQLLLTLESPELRQKLSRAEEELRLARATLTAEAARLEWQGQVDADRHQQAVAEYYEAWGNLLNEQAQLDLAKRRLVRARELAAQDAIAGEDVESATHAESGQRLKIAKLETAVDELRRRAEAVPQVASQRKQQLEPHLLRLAGLQAEIVRCHEELAKGRIKSTVSGVVIKRECLAGDYAHLRGSVLSLLEEGTAEVALYVPQSAAERLSIGDVLQIQVRPQPESMACRVVRIGQQFQQAPQPISRHYLSNEPLLQVFLRPESPTTGHFDLCLGAVAHVPKSWLPGVGTKDKSQGEQELQRRPGS